jgi:hypothetical protein
MQTQVIANLSQLVVMASNQLIYLLGEKQRSNVLYESCISERSEDAANQSLSAKLGGNR